MKAEQMRKIYQLGRSSVLEEHTYQDGLKFQFLCHICTEDPARFRKMMSQALTLDEYRAAVDKEMAK